MPSLNLRNVLRRNPDRPSLRERAEALKVSAGRLIRRKDAPAEISASAPMPADATTPDPVLTAYAAARAADAEMAALQQQLTEAMTPGWFEREAALSAVQVATHEAAWRMVPTTHEGRRAFVDYARAQVEIFTGPSGRLDCPDDLLRSVLATLSAMVEAEHPSGEDAAALALVDAIEREWAAFIGLERRNGDDDSAEVNSRFAAAMDRRSALLDAAEALPTRSRGARHAKALALAWIIAADLQTDAQPREQYATDDRLALDLMDSLAGDAPAVGARALQPVGPAPSALDLSGCSVPQIARLYEAFRAAYDHLSALGRLPCFSTDSDLNAAGRIIDREADRLAKFFSACAEEIARHAPTSRHERDDALATRLMHEIACNGRIHDPALMRDITTAWGA